jgi:leader peptidase (prepilin peptidase)/N-methyltransferase
MSIFFVGYSIFSTLLILAFFIDMYHRIIPDVVTLPGIAVGFFFSWLAPRASATDVGMWLAEDARGSLFGILLGSGILLLTAYGGKLLFRKDAMGGGDVTLAAMVGAFLGWKYLLFTLFISFLSGSLTGLILIGRRKKTMASIIPFGPFISGSALFALFCGEKLLMLYLRLYV